MKQFSFIGGKQGLNKSWGVGRGFRGKCTSLANVKVLAMLCFHKDEFQILAEHVLMEREEV